MDILQTIDQKVPEALKALYDINVSADKLIVNTTKKEFEGDYTVVTFPFSRDARKKPDVIAEDLGKYLIENVEEFTAYNVIKGFLNLTVSDTYWKAFLETVLENESYGKAAKTGEKALVEFSSPNTNKPLHLGHIRNILLGWSTANILDAAGHDVKKVQIINDRGIAVCKSMLAWQKFGEGKTPASEKMKSDHFVGHWYVGFEKHFKVEYAAWQKTDAAQTLLAEKNVTTENVEAFFKKYKNTYFNEYSQLGAEAKAMLLKWEAADEEVRNLWKKMNGWVYAGFEETYKDLGVHFDKLYYESETYLLGKDIIQEGLEKDIFYKKEDNSVWIDLEDVKMDHKLVLRSDGTSVYITQDIGTAHLRYEDFGTEKMIYVVADEQNYHFKALFETLKKLDEPYAKGCYHLNYGMVNLPSGRMKSREGTVVDADDLMQEVINEASKNTEEIGTLADVDEAVKQNIFRQIGLAALKYFIIKVNPKKSMIFDPSESVDMQGQTGPSIQYAAVRVKSAIRKTGDKYDLSLSSNYAEIQQAEKEVVMLIHQYPEIIQEAAKDYDPSHVANYCYALAKAYNKFWASGLSMLNAESEEAGAFRLKMSQGTLQVLTSALEILGIEVPERM